MKYGKVMDAEKNIYRAAVRRRKVLVVDDDFINRRILGEILQADYDVIEAVDGAKALEFLRANPGEVSAVLLDIMMPVLDGYGVLAAMRVDNALSGIPVIVMTAGTEIDAEVKALSSGAIDFVLKPYNPTIIKHRLGNMISLRENAAIVNAIKIDALTGIYTREGFFEKVEELLAEKPAGYYVLASFDVDSFKVINDQYGTAKGDLVLKQIADVFKEGFGAIGGISARITADNFAVLYPQSYLDSKHVKEIARKATVLDQSIAPLSFSVGRYLVNDFSLSPSAMYDRATIAEESIKARFDKHIAVYDDEMLAHILQEQEITSEMNDALSRGEFEVWYQPQYNHSTGALVGAEALVRWRHKKRGLIPPNVFIPVFERNGFIYELDKFVWESVCKSLRKWLSEGRSPLPVSVNISRYDLFRDDLCRVVTGLIKKYDLPPSMLRVEITESAFAQSAEQIIKVVKELIDGGFTVEIDDFGSGYSSLNTLKDVPAHVVKLDMRFLEGKDKSNRGGNIVESVVRMTNWLGMAVIAEGVETKAQADYLASVGCPYVQGYLYAKPMPIEDYEKLGRAAQKEEKFISLVTVENLDNEAFWNPESIETLIFNSYVGGACIFEYHDDNAEILRVNQKYAAALGFDSIEDALKIKWKDFMDEENAKKSDEVVALAIRTRDEVVDEMPLRNFRGDGRTLYLRSTMRVVASAGTRYLFYCLVENITKQRHAEKKEREAAEQLRTVMDDTPGGFVRLLVKEKGVVGVFVNKGFCDMLGYDEEELMEHYRTDALWKMHPDDVAYVTEIVKNLIVSRKTGSAKYRVMCKDGTYKQFLVFARVVESDGGTFINVYYNDSSELSKTEELRRELIENMPCGAGIYELRGNHIIATYLNKRYRELVGIGTLEEPQLETVVHPSDKQKVLGAIRQALKSGESGEVDARLLHGSGEYRPFRISGTIMRQEKGRTAIYATYTPVSESEIAYREMLPTVLATVMASTTDYSFVKDVNLNYICASRGFAQMVGIEDEKEIVGKSDFDLFDSVLAEKYRADDKKIMAGGESLIDYVERLPNKEGTGDRFSSTSKYLLRDAFGAVIGLYGVGRDITETRDAYERLKLLTDSLPCGLARYEFSADGSRPLYFSDGFYALMGYPKREYDALVEDNVYAFVEDEDLAHVYDTIQTALENGERFTFEYRHKQRRGGGKWVKAEGTVADSVNGRKILNMVFFDVSREKADKTRLATSYRAIDVATENVGLSIWLYNIDTKTISRDDFQSRIYTGYTGDMRNIPQSLIGTGIIDKNCEQDLLDMYEALLRGAPHAECTVYMFNRVTEKYEWQRLLYTRLPDELYHARVAIGCAINVDIEHESMARFENEHQLRRELVKKSVFYYQLNLSSGLVEEYYSSYAGKSKMSEGTELSEELRASILENVAEEDRERVKNTIFSSALFSAYLNGKTSASCVYRRMTKDGLRYVETTASIMKRPNTDEIIAFLHCTDIDTERKDELVLEAIMDEEIESVLLLNKKSGKAHIVRTRVDLGGLAEHEVFDFDSRCAGLTDSNVLEEDRAANHAFFKTATLAKRLETEDTVKIDYRIAQGDVVRRKLTRAYNLDCRGEDIVVVRRDITDMYEEEQRQKQMLKEAAAAANTANEAKSAFLSRMSHDMRTPLNAVLSFSSEEMNRGEEREQLLDNLDKIHTSSTYLHGLIDDVLDMAKLDQKKFRLVNKPYNLDNFLKIIENVIGESARKKGVEFDVKVGDGVVRWVKTDRVRYNEVFVNLLSNAVKFTPKGGKVEFIVEQTATSENNVITPRITVRDNGRGMSKEFLPHAFESFSQENEIDGEHGAGLGLAIVKEIVELMDGTISVESEQGKGTTFVVEIPLEVIPSPVEAKKTHFVDCLKGMNVLLCEDNQLNVEIALNLLKRQGASVTVAANGREGVDAFVTSPEHHYQAVLMDIRMPVLNGLDAAKEIRRLSRADAKTVPIIAMTADVLSEEEQKTLASEMNAYLFKPIEPRKLFATILTYLEE